MQPNSRGPPTITRGAPPIQEPPEQETYECVDSDQQENYECVDEPMNASKKAIFRLTLIRVVRKKENENETWRIVNENDNY